MLADKQNSIVAYDTLINMLCELVSHHQQFSDAGCKGQDWQSADGRTQVLIYGNSLALSGVLQQRADAIRCEYVLLFNNQHVLTWKQYRWPRMATSNKGKPEQGLFTINSECLHDLMKYHALADTRWHRHKSNTLRCECAA